MSAEEHNLYLSLLSLLVITWARARSVLKINYPIMTCNTGHHFSLTIASTASITSTNLIFFCIYIEFDRIFLIMWQFSTFIKVSHSTETFQKKKWHGGNTKTITNPPKMLSDLLLSYSSDQKNTAMISSFHRVWFNHHYKSYSN